MTSSNDFNLLDDELRFGDEIEVGIVKIDKVAKTVKICVKSAEIRDVRFALSTIAIRISSCQLQSIVLFVLAL